MSEDIRHAYREDLVAEIDRLRELLRSLVSMAESGIHPAQFFLDECKAALSPAPVGVTHQCPPSDSEVMPCCGRSPLEVARTDTMTAAPQLVTCHGTGSTEQACPECGGTELGHADGCKHGLCQECGGSGIHTAYDPLTHTGIREPCEACHGTGRTRSKR